MPLYSTSGITFLPKPPPTALSFGPEASRLRLPDCQDVKHLAEFVSRLLVYNFDCTPSLAVHLKFGAIFVVFLLLVVLSIIARRMYEQSFWIVRIVKRPTGRLIVPNSMICFALIEGFFCAAFMAMMWCVYALFYPKSIAPVMHPIWMLLPWCPLIGGAIWAAWGLYFATPLHLRTGITRRKQPVIFELLGHPMVANTIGFTSPLVVTASIVVPCTLAMRQWTRAYRLEQQWQEKYAGQTAFTTAMVQDAQRVWHQVLQSIELVAIGYLLWATWALLIFLAYVSFSFRLIRVIRRETNKMNDIGPRSGIAVVGPATIHAMDERSVMLNESEKIQRPRSETYELELRGASPHYKAHTLPAREAEDQSSKPKRSPFQHLRFSVPHLVMSDRDTGTNFVGRHFRRDQVSLLNKALFHICIQACAIGPACFTFLVISFALGLGLVSSLEHSFEGGSYIEPTLAIALISVIWTVVVFGSITLLAIAQRTYEHMFANVQFNAQSCIVGGLQDGQAPSSRLANVLPSCSPHTNSLGEQIITHTVVADGGLEDAVLHINRDESKNQRSGEQELHRVQSIDSIPFCGHSIRDRISMQDWPQYRPGNGVKFQRTTMTLD